MLDRVRKALTAMLWGHVFAAVGNLVLVPLYLTYWSPAQYGEWLALLATAGYLSVLDLGLNQAATNRLTQAFSRGDLEGYARCQHSVFASYLAVAGVAGALLAAALWLLPLPLWLGLQETSPHEAIWVMLLLGLTALWGMPAGFMWSVYRTTGQASKSQWMLNAQQLIGLGWIMVALVFGGGMISVAMGPFAAVGAVTLYVFWDLRTRRPTLVPALERARLAVLRSLIQPSFRFGLLTASNVITMHGSVLIIATMLGGTAVAVFVTARTLVSLIRLLGGSLLNAMWPEITDMQARGERDRLRQWHRLMMASSTALCLGVAAALWYEAPEMITVWTRGKLQPDPILLRLLLILFVFQSTWLVSFLFPAAADRHERLSWLYAASVLIGIAMTMLLIDRLGTWAVPVGLCIGEATICYHWVIRETCRMVGEPYGSFSLKLWSGVLAAGTLALITGWVAHVMIPGPPVVRWLGVGSITLATTVAVYWNIGVTPEDRARLLIRLRPAVMVEGDRAS